MKHRFVNVLLSLVLVAGLLPVQAFGGEEAGLEPAAPTQSVEEIAASLEGCEYEEGTLLVAFENAATKEGVLQVLSDDAIDDAFDSELVAEEVAAGEGFAQVTLKEGVSVAEGIAALQDSAAVAYVQPNFVYRLPADEDVLDSTPSVSGLSALSDDGANQAETTTNDPYTASSSTSSDTLNAWHLYDINAFDAWDSAQVNGTVTVVVLDTGCRMDHEDLTANLLAAYSRDMRTNGQLTEDINGHGTHVCGLVAATANNGLGTAGASYNAKIIPINVFEKVADGKDAVCYTNVLVSAYDYLLGLCADHPELNIRVVNMSLGNYGGPDTYDLLLQNRVRQAQMKGVVTVAAGGNGISGEPQTSSHYPSDFPEVIAVTALSTDKSSPTTWSDYNSCKNICAPGSFLYSTSSSGSSDYETRSGTSMASPVVAGAVALLFAANPDLTVVQAKKALLTTTDAITVDSGREGQYGTGKLNLSAAVAKAKSYAEGGGEEETSDIIVGDPEAPDPSDEMPYENNYRYGASQTVYSAAELGNKAVAITSLSYYVSQMDEFSTDSVQVYMGHVAAGSSISEVSVSDMTLVYSGAPTLGTSYCWERLEFSSAFDYNGTDDLVIAAYRSSSNYTYSLKYAQTSGAALSRRSDDVSDYANPLYEGHFKSKESRPVIKLETATDDPRTGLIDCAGVTTSFSDSQEYAWVANDGVLQSTNQGVELSTSWTEISFTAQEAFTVSFDWKVSSEEDYDLFTVVKDGATFLTSSGTMQGTETYAFAAGTHTVRFAYEKDASFEAGSDQASVWNIAAKVVGEHEHVPVVVVAGAAGSCVADGYTDKTVCSLCEEVLQERTSTGGGSHDYNSNDVCALCARSRGDVNENGTLNIVDAQLAYDIAKGLLTSLSRYKTYYSAADVASGEDGGPDGEVTANDAWRIQYLAVHR